MGRRSGGNLYRVKTLELAIAEGSGGLKPAVIPIDEILLAGYTGRDREAVLEHIRELEKIGVAPPPAVPMIYVADASLLTTEDSIEVSEEQTSGEAEACLMLHDGELLVCAGSDHTDRKHEAVDIAESKTLCRKPISHTAWRFADVRDHWDDLQLRSWASQDGVRRLYQEGSMRDFMAVDALMSELARAGHEQLQRRFIFGGTLPTLTGLVCGDRFEVELRDPVLQRSIGCAYQVRLHAEGLRP
jgi:Protein of unknown function (DUF2848)